MKKYSSREKQLALKFVDEGAYVSDVVERLRIPRRTIYNWLQKRDRGESLENKKIPGRPPKKRLTALPIVIGLVQSNKDFYLREIQKLLVDDHGIQVSLPTIADWVKHSGYTIKKNVPS